MTDTQPRPKVGQRIRHSKTYRDGTTVVTEGVVCQPDDGFTVCIGASRSLWRAVDGPSNTWEVLAEPQPPLRLGMVANIRLKGSNLPTWVAMLRLDYVTTYWMPADTREAKPLDYSLLEVVGEPLFDGVGDPL